MVHSSHELPSAVYHYQLQEWAVAPVYHRPTPSPQKKRRQDTLTQNEWGARPIPSGWTEHTDGSGDKFYVHKRTKRWAPTYEHMFVKEAPEHEPTETEPSKNLTQRSYSSDASQEEPRKKKSRIAPTEEVLEVQTEMLPGSQFALDFARRKEAANDDDKENESKIANRSEDEEDEGDDADEEDGSSQETQWLD